jgi:hypothetical protein
MFAKNPAAAAKLQSPSALTALHKVRYACRGRLISRFVPRQKIKKVRADLANYTSSKTDRSLDQFIPRRVKKTRESAACILNRTFYSQVLILPVLPMPPPVPPPAPPSS